MRILLILAALLAAGAVANAQNPWRDVAPPSASSFFLTDADFPTPGTGYVVGWGGGQQAVVLTSADSGSTWTGAATTGFIMYGVHFSSAGSGVIAAYNYDCKCGAIVKTGNGGVDWNTMTFPGTGALQSLSFPDAGHGFAASDDGAILKTTDGGSTWLSKKAGTISFAKIFFTTPTLGYALTVGSGGRPSQIHRSTDGGDTWTLLGDFSSTRVFGDIFFTSSTTGFIVGMENGLAIYKTTDGGDHWERRYSGPNGEEQLLNAVHFSDARNGFAAGNDGKMLRTKDGGDTWTLEASGTTSAIKAIRTISPKVAVAVGDFGTIVKRYDLGAGQTPTAIINADGLEFGNVKVGVAKQASLTIGDANNAELDITSVTIGGADAAQFRIVAPKPDALPAAIEGTETLDVMVEVQPTVSGSLEADLVVTTNDPALPQKHIALSANAVAGIPVTASGDAAIADADITPNPIASEAALRLHLSAPRRITAALYDPAGRLVRTLHEGALPAGVTIIAIDAGGLASGSYQCVINTGAGTITRPVTVVH